MLVVHDNLISSNAQKVRLLLRELGEPFELRPVPFADRPDWHLAANPTGGIPVLVDGDVVVAESNAILRYLARRAGRDDLYPVDLADRARVDWLLDHLTTWLRPALIGIEKAAFGLRPGLGLGTNEPQPERVPAALASIASKLEVSERLLGVPPFAALGRYTLVDVAATPVLHRLLRSGADIAPFPRLASWAEACVARPAWLAMLPEVGV